VIIHATDLHRSAEWWTSLGMRPVHHGDDLAILELRGGTHLLIFPDENPPAAGAPAPFDLMVDDVDATHAAWEAEGLAPSAVAPAPGDHRTFTVSDPDGHVLTVYSTHVVGAV
jgi:catechol 2,3-dioxygenase-like lactoylglutathione lyase family enzyme